MVHYEVYTLGGQRWTLHARFRQGERDEALEEAKNVERTLGIAAKVVRETYYAANNYSEEQVLYPGDQALRNRATAPVSYRGRGYGGGGGDFQVPDFRNRRAAPQHSMGMALKLMVIVAASLTLAGALTGAINIFFGKLPDYGFAVSHETVSLLLFSTFIVSFLSTAVPMAVKMIDWHDESAAPKAKRPAAAAPPPKPEPAPPPVVQPKPPEELDKAGDEEVDWDNAEEDGDEPLPPLEDDSKTEEEKADGAAEAEAAAEGEPADAEQAAEADPSAEAGKEAALESCQRATMHYLTSLLPEIKKVRPTLDAYNKFGIDLVLAGAVDVLGGQRELDIEDKRKILKEAIQVIGTKPETAQAFAAKYEDYLVEPRYMSMVQAGRSSMESFLAGAEAIADDVATLFEVWNKPTKAAQASPRIMTVFFTDMVGSTDLTQARGDQAAQHIVRRHNSIVRAALAEFSGKEIKHTGDGIMASFNSAANGVEASIVIHRAIAAHNQKHPDQPLHVRIGINAGEPIEEEDDLFGTTVQLAARVCAKTGTDEILCTNVVRELAAGKGLVFLSKGSHELKGFKETIALYQVLWDPKEIAAAAPPEAKKNGAAAGPQPAPPPAVGKPAAAPPVKPGPAVARPPLPRAPSR